MRPLSRGYVEVRSSRPGDMPAINPRYLSEEIDRRAIIGGLRLARRIFAAPALKPFVREESLPGAHVQADDELLDYVRRNGSTCYHATCTRGRRRPDPICPPSVGVPQGKHSLQISRDRNVKIGDHSRPRRR
jgi:choline dehydrogenase-like flavoprotein